MAVGAMQNSTDDFDIEVEDGNELSNKSRIRDLLNRRKEVLNARNQARAEMQLTNGNSVEALEVYHTYLTGLILDLWTKLVETPAGMELLQRKPIYSFEVHPPKEELDRLRRATGVKPPKPHKVTIKGLNWFVQQDSVIITETFWVKTWHPPGEKKLQTQQPIPWAALDRAFIGCQEYMNEIGVDADLGLDNYTGENADGEVEPGV